MCEHAIIVGNLENACTKTTLLVKLYKQNYKTCSLSAEYNRCRKYLQLSVYVSVWMPLEVAMGDVKSEWMPLEARVLANTCRGKVHR